MSLIMRLKEHIDSLMEIGHDIADTQSKYVTGYLIPFNSNAELDKRFEELLELKREIEKYNINRNIKILNEVVSLIKGISKDSFIERKDGFLICSSKNHSILKLLDLISQIKSNEDKPQ